MFHKVTNSPLLGKNWTKKRQHFVFLI